MVVPKTPENAPKIKYKMPISLWFVEKNHREKKVYKEKGHGIQEHDFSLTKNKKKINLKIRLFNLFINTTIANGCICYNKFYILL